MKEQYDRKKYYLAIDQGGQSTRVGIYDQQGSLLHFLSAPCETRRFFDEQNNTECVEQDPLEMLQGLKNCLEKIVSLLNGDTPIICAAGFAGQGSSLLCWDNISGDALTPVISWQDVRGKKYLEHVPLTNARVQSLTGLRLSAHYGATKIRWCLENSATAQTALRNGSLRVGPIVSYLFWHLLDKKNVVDPGHAQRTLLWNMENNCWDITLLNTFNIPENILPECKFHNSLFGFLNVADQQFPFTATARDQGASLFSRGVPDKNACYVNIGTGAFIQRVCEDINAPDGLLVSPLWLPENKYEPAFYAWEATVNGAASAIDYLQQQSGMEITAAVIEQVLALDPQQGYYFLNAIGGVGAPYWRTDVESFFSENLLPAEKILAWIESIIFQIVVNIERMSIVGKPHKIYISGGLSNSDGICQRLADLTRICVVRSDNTDATLQGIAFMATGFSSKWKPQEIADIFMPEKNPRIFDRFNQWQNAVEVWLGN